MPFWINIIVALLSFAVAAIGGKALIPYLHQLKFGQPIKMDFGPKWHAKKQGTPTMGGILFIVSSILAAAVGYVLYRVTGAEDAATVLNGSDKMALQVAACMVFSLLFGVIGFVDDFIKVAKKHNEGLTPKQKLALQIVIAIAWLAVMYALGDKSTVIDLAFVQFDAHFVYYPLMVLVILYMTNAVNLTDGVDGLCGTVTLVVMLLMTLICNMLQMYPYSLFTMAVAGGCLGFLVWNLHPAKCFMGDTGSLALGGFVVATAYMLQMPLYILIVGLIYLAEVISVMVQVTYFKYTKKKTGVGKRIFRMAPLHHHFELGGWSETRVVAVFAIVTALLCMLALLGL